ncbi:MAG TPA: hypothetical protein VI542_27795 [Candidatus Tectomicrobia bacterium]
MTETRKTPSILGQYLPTDPLMQQAFVDCLRWSVTEVDIVTAFREETGCQWTPGSTPIYRMIDAASGAGRDVYAQYVAWFAQHVWGKMEKPIAEVLRRLPSTGGTEPRSGTADAGN